MSDLPIVTKKINVSHRKVDKCKVMCGPFWNVKLFVALFRGGLNGLIWNVYYCWEAVLDAYIFTNLDII